MRFKPIFILAIIVLVSICFYHYNHYNHYNHFQSSRIETFDNGLDSDDSDDSDDGNLNDGNGNSGTAGVGPAPICFKKTPRNPTIYNDLKMFQINMKQLNRRMDTLQKQITTLSTMRKQAGLQGTQNSSESSSEM